MKMFGQEFSPITYLEKKKTEYSISQRYITGLMTDQTQGIVVYTDKQDNEFHRSWLGDSGSGVWKYILSMWAPERIETFRFSEMTVRQFS
mmetsp:Transcript_21323/g.26233  ORF Transcript_21323/g.26233 Transcript_21323/m.26233 type:complete len:90 (+) Transcript_21323:746-1015(+)